MTAPNLRDDAVLAIGFLTRLPVTLPATSPPGALAHAMRLFPLAGALIGLLIALGYGLAQLILPAWPAALLAVGGGILLTGGLHEDGLADCADGFGGGADKEQKLAIMKDSRIGSYGALALILSVALRSAALASIEDWRRVTAALLVAHSTARAVLPVMMLALPNAKESGLAALAGRPRAADAGPAVLLALLPVALLLPSAAGFAVLVTTLSVTLAFLALVRRQIGGTSGDALGALEQLVEIGVLLAVLTVWRRGA